MRKVLPMSVNQSVTHVGELDRVAPEVQTMGTCNLSLSPDRDGHVCHPGSVLLNLWHISSSHDLKPQNLLAIMIHERHSYFNK